MATSSSSSAPLGSTARTNELLSAASAQTGIKAPTFNIDSPATVAANVSKGIGTPQNPGGNPLDNPGATPVAQPGKNLDGTPLGNTAAPNPATPPQTTPSTSPTPTASGTSTSTTPSGIPGDAALTGSTADQATQAIDQLKAKYGGALNTLNNSGVTSPSSQGSANAGVQTALNAQPTPQQQPNVPPSVEALFGGDNTNIQQQVQNLQDIISPPAERQALTDAIDSLQTDRASLANLKVEQMNIKNIMSGTTQDILNEVQAAGGTITQSLLANMTVARNKALLQQSTNLQEQIQSTQDLVTTDTTLVGDEKSTAAQQATERMGLLNFVKTNYDNQLKAAQTSLTEMQKTEGWSGIYKAALASGDPQAVAKINATMGGVFDLATAAKNDTTAAQNQANLAHTQAETRSANATADKALEDNGTPNPANAGKPGYTDTGIKYTPALGTKEINNLIQTNGLTGTKNLLAPSDYNHLKSLWVLNGLKDSDFDSIYGGMKDPNLATKHVYN